MNNELDRMCKEAVLANLKYYSRNFMAGVIKMTKELSLYNESRVRDMDAGFLD